MRQICKVDVSGLLPLLVGFGWRTVGNMTPWSWLSESLKQECEKVIAQILPHFPGRKRGLAWLSRRVPGEAINAHIDQEDSSCQERIHVPLVTNPHARLWQGGVSHHMEVGFAYQFDPTQTHSVCNFGDTDRIHLFFNAVARDGEGSQC